MREQFYYILELNVTMYLYIFEIFKYTSTFKCLTKILFIMNIDIGLPLEI